MTKNNSQLHQSRVLFAFHIHGHDIQKHPDGTIVAIELQIERKIIPHNGSHQLFVLYQLGKNNNHKIMVIRSQLKIKIKTVIKKQSHWKIKQKHGDHKL